jgi:hypothetical protein
MKTLVAISALVGMWIWVVRNRGNWHPFLANLAGAGAGLVAIGVVAVLNAALFGTELHEGINIGVSLLAIMTSAGACAGVWMWLANRPQPEHPVARQLLGALCGFVSGVTTLVFFSLTY